MDSWIGSEGNMFGYYGGKSKDLQQVISERGCTEKILSCIVSRSGKIARTTYVYPWKSGKNRCNTGIVYIVLRRMCDVKLVFDLKGLIEPHYMSVM